MLACATDGVGGDCVLGVKESYEQYVDGKDEIPSETNDPLEVFDITGVKNVIRLVVFVLWLKRQPI